jgi:hypothetical protein
VTGGLFAEPRSALGFLGDTTRVQSAAALLAARKGLESAVGRAQRALEPLVKRAEAGASLGVLRRFPSASPAQIETFNLLLAQAKELFPEPGAFPAGLRPLEGGFCSVVSLYQIGITLEGYIYLAMHRRPPGS